MVRFALLTMVLFLLAAACSSTVDDDDTAATEGGNEPSATPQDETSATAPPSSTYPPPPEVPDGPLAAPAREILDRVLTSPPGFDTDAAAELTDTGDPRVLWVVSDLLRFISTEEQQDVLRDVAESLGGIDTGEDVFIWNTVTNHLLAWDLPAYDGYAGDKEAIFTAVEPGWAPFFDDPDATIDWRQVSWGGVFIDDRPFGATEPCLEGCIPSLDDPEFVSADQGDYYPDERIVFGVQIGEDTVALPRNIMEVHEMVNTTLGGRQVAIPYCTLCGAAQVFFTDSEGGGTGEMVMRTSGLLRRSNKVMYDLTTQSVFDTFTGEAVTGPLREDGVVLEQASVVTSTWGEWKDAHPDTLIIAGDGGIGRSYPLDPLRGRDDDGPIFPIGDVDPRLPVQEQVLGVTLEDGTFLAFPVAEAVAALEAGEEVTLEGVELRQEASGVVALRDGVQLPAHQAFWFAWSQFHPSTLLWSRG